MSPTRLEWLLRLSLKQMDECYLEGKKASYQGFFPRACPYQEHTAKHFAWMRGWHLGERDARTATD